MRTLLSEILILLICCLLVRSGDSQELTLIHPDLRIHPESNENVHDQPAGNFHDLTPSILLINKITKPAEIQNLTLSISQHQSFFCEIENAIEKRSGLAPRFRLGSLEYVNALEGYSK